MRTHVYVISSLLLSSGLIACGSSQPKQTGPDPCKIGEQHLRQAIGPEFGRIKTRVISQLEKQSPHACALVYTRLAEELPDELEGEATLLAATDHRLAIMYLSETSPPRFRRIPSSKGSPGSVSMKLKSADVNGDKTPDFIVEERAKVKGDTLGYRGLRIFNGMGRGTELIFDEVLKIKTKEGLELIPRWSLEVKHNERFIILRGGGESIRFAYSNKDGRFVKIAKPMKKKAKNEEKIAPLDIKGAQQKKTREKASKAKKAGEEQKKKPGPMLLPDL